MIYYFSGLGNTAYAAKKIAEYIGDKCFFIPHVKPEVQKFEYGEGLGILFPIYSWGVPPIVIDFIKSLDEDFISDIKKKGSAVWAVCIYGDEAGNAIKMLQKTFRFRGLELIGAWGITAPNTYVLLPGFDVDSQEVEKKKLEKAQIRIKEIAEKIKSGSWEVDVKRGSFPALRSAIYPGFIKYGMNTKKWHFSSACVRCGKCVKSCPINNICMGNEGPEWGTNCISCLACYHNCPYHAVEYGKVTKNKGQYVCPLK